MASFPQRKVALCMIPFYLFCLILSWQEEVEAKEELDQLRRVKYGSANLNIEKGQKGFQRRSESDQHWNIKKTAKTSNFLHILAIF